MPEDYSSAMKEIPRMKTITVSTVSEKLRITGSLAYRLIRKLAKEGTLKKIYDSGGFLLYTKSAKQIALEKERAAKAEEASKAKGKKGKKGGKKSTKK